MTSLGLRASVTDISSVDPEQCLTQQVQQYINYRLLCTHISLVFYNKTLLFNSTFHWFMS